MNTVHAWPGGARVFVCLLLGGGGAAVRANPATSAPSHICETWRNVAQTCLNIKEIGPERSRINVCDPIEASF